jgi:nucleotide-binding universal stress UspA family protein
LGLPTETQKQTDDSAGRLIHNELPVLRRAECALLVVNQPPRPVERIVAQYEGGWEGKSLLRFTGALAEQYGARVGILTVRSDIAEATQWVSAAADYLKGYQLPSLETFPLSGPVESTDHVARAAASFGADLIAMGETGHGFLGRFLGQNVAERTALATTMPLLIAR